MRTTTADHDDEDATDVRVEGDGGEEWDIEMLLRRYRCAPAKVGESAVPATGLLTVESLDRLRS